MSTAAHFRAQLAYGSRRDVQYPPERLAQLRSDYHSARRVEGVRRAIQTAGPFTPDQARELTSIIGGQTATQAAPAA